MVYKTIDRDGGNQHLGLFMGREDLAFSAFLFGHISDTGRN